MKCYNYGAGKVAFIKTRRQSYNIEWSFELLSKQSYKIEWSFELLSNQSYKIEWNFELLSNQSYKIEWSFELLSIVCVCRVSSLTKHFQTPEKDSQQYSDVSTNHHISQTEGQAFLYSSWPE